jgi:hypothetical protein
MGVSTGRNGKEVEKDGRGLVGRGWEKKKKMK